MEYNYLEILVKTFIIPARQNQFIQENYFNNAPVRLTAIARSTNSAIAGSQTQNPFSYQQFDFRHFRILRGDQPVDFDGAHNCCLYVTTIKTMNFQDCILSIRIDNFTDHYALVFDLTSMRDDTENFHYQELVGEPMRLKLNFSSPLEYITELFVLGEPMYLFAIDKSGVVGKII